MMHLFLFLVCAYPGEITELYISPEESPIDEAAVVVIIEGVGAWYIDQDGSIPMQLTPQREYTCVTKKNAWGIRYLLHVGYNTEWYKWFGWYSENDPITPAPL